MIALLKERMLEKKYSKGRQKRNKEERIIKNVGCTSFTETKWLVEDSEKGSVVPSRSMDQ